MRRVLCCCSLLLVLLLVGSAYGKKAVVGVTGIGTSAQNISCQGWDAYSGRDCNKDLSDGFRVMLETSIIKAGKMDVLERAQMNDSVMRERFMGQEGLTDAGGQVGGVTGADYLIYGTITKFGSKASGMSVSTSSGLGAKLGRKTGGALGSGIRTSKVTVQMGVDVKVTDVGTGRIVIADEVEAEVKQGGGFAVGGISKEESTGDAFADVQRVVAVNIAEKIMTHHIPFKVVKAKANGHLIINYGSVFLAPGDRLAAYRVGEAFVDPDTGEELGAEETLLGAVEIVSVSDRFSEAQVVGKAFDAVPGSILKRVAVDGGKKSKKRKRSGSRIR